MGDRKAEALVAVEAEDPTVSLPLSNPLVRRLGLALTGRHRALRLVSKAAAELVIVFVGVYGAFLLNNYQAARDRQARRAQILAELDVFSTRALQEPFDFERMVARPFLDVYDAGKMPRPKAFAISLGYSSSDWDALIQAGGLDALDVSFIAEMNYFHAHARAVIDLLRHDRELMDTLILPHADDPPGEFYGKDGKLRARYAWYLEMMRSRGADLKELKDAQLHLLGRIRKLRGHR